MFIPNKSTRTLLKKFATKYLQESEFADLMNKVKMYVPCLTDLLTTLSKNKLVYPSKEEPSRVFCAKEWTEFLQALASPSPVCALVPPRENVIQLLKVLQVSDACKANADTMVLLQREIPVLFRLLETLTHYPINTMMPILNRLITVALTPFSDENSQCISEPQEDCDDSFGYFPQLPRIRNRKHYVADRSHSSVCTKKSSRHPSLLPGIFTLYCEHGTVSCCISHSSIYVNVILPMLNHYRNFPIIYTTVAAWFLCNYIVVFCMNCTCLVS